MRETLMIADGLRSPRRLVLAMLRAPLLAPATTPIRLDMLHTLTPMAHCRQISSSALVMPTQGHRRTALRHIHTAPSSQLLAIPCIPFMRKTRRIHDILEPRHSRGSIRITQRKHPCIPWAAMAQLRHMLAHLTITN